MRAWGIVPASVDEREVADSLLGEEPLLLCCWTGVLLGTDGQRKIRAQGTQVVLTPGRPERRKMPLALRRPVARLRNRIETSIGELTEQLGPARHGAKTFWGLITRTVATILAHTLQLLSLV